MLSSGVKRELTWIITFIWVMALVGWLADAWLMPLLVFILVYIGRQLWSTYKFEKWMKGESKTDYPPVSGFWSEVSYQVSKKQRALEKHADIYLYKSEQFQAASMLIPSAIVSLDDLNHIEWFNDPSKDMLGVRRQDVGRRIEGIMRQPDFLEYLKSEDYQFSIQVKLNTSLNRTYDVRLIPYFENHKLLIAQDITELYQLAQIRRDFVANASHELRTPLTVLSGYVELMQDMSDEPSWKMPLQHMSEQSSRMKSIIEDLLTLSSLEADSITAQAVRVNVPQMLNMLKKDLERLSAGKHQLVFEIDPKLQLIGFQEPLKSLFGNLLSNALRYSPDGGRVLVKWQMDTQGARFSVADQGLGIAAEHIPRLTERFYRVDKDRSRVTGGTGLGLAIVKHVLEKHDSALEIQSQLGQGSEFSCRFTINRCVR